MTKEESNLLRNYPGKLIGMHNHPSNLPPTGSDYVASGFRGYQLGIVGTHDGKLFVYRHGNRPVLPTVIDKRLEEACLSCKNDDEERKAYSEEFRKIAQDIGLKCEEK